MNEKNLVLLSTLTMFLLVAYSGHIISFAINTGINIGELISK